MRLTNLDQLALGYPALAEDPTFVGLASDRSFTCPSRLEPAGRALDLAQRGNLDHAIPGCATGGTASVTLLDLLPALGYSTFRAENIGWNAGLGPGRGPPHEGPLERSRGRRPGRSCPPGAGADARDR